MKDYTKNVNRTSGHSSICLKNCGILNVNWAFKKSSLKMMNTLGL